MGRPVLARAVFAVAVATLAVGCGGARPGTQVVTYVGPARSTPVARYPAPRVEHDADARPTDAELRRRVETAVLTAARDTGCAPELIREAAGSRPEQGVVRLIPCGGLERVYVLRPGGAWTEDADALVYGAPAPPPPSASSPPPPTYVSPPVGSGTGDVHVRGYYRRDGTYVHPYTRRAPRPHRK